MTYNHKNDPADNGQDNANIFDDDDPRPKGRSGYKNPPKHSQYRPGTSGNPKGRPRRRSIKEHFYTFMMQPAAPTGSLAEMSRLDAFHQILFKKGMEGNMQAIQCIKKWSEEAEAGLVKEVLAKIGAMGKGFSEESDIHAVVSRMDEFIEKHFECFHEQTESWTVDYADRVRVEGMYGHGLHHERFMPGATTRTHLDELRRKTDQANESVKRAHNREQVKKNVESMPADEQARKLKAAIDQITPHIEALQRKSPQKLAEVSEKWDKMIAAKGENESGKTTRKNPERPPPRRR